MPSYPPLKLTYFDGPGRAEAIRLAFHLGNVPFVDERLSKEEFAKRKPTFVYGQVPVLEVDGEVIAQADGLLRYAGKLAGLYPLNDPLAALRVDEILAAEDELLGKMSARWMERDPAKVQHMERELVQTTIPCYLAMLEKRVAKMQTTPAFQTDHLFIHELIIAAQVAMLHSGMLQGFPDLFMNAYPTLQAVAAKVQANPKVQQWNALHQHPGFPKLKLTYFKGHGGRAEAARLALVIGGVPFEDELLDRDAFAKRKEDLPYHQLPVLEVDGEVVAQSLPILRYAGTLAGLYPTTDLKTALRADEIVNYLEDISRAALPVILAPDADAKAAAAKTLVESTLPRLVGVLDQRLAHWGGPYAVGETMTIADLVVFNMVHNFQAQAAHGLPEFEVDGFENVKRVYQQVDEHDKVKAWFAKQA